MKAGSRIGDFEIRGLLGQGGMGAVYSAHDTTLQREVALKVLLPEVVGDPDRLARFKREAQVLASLNHPNIAQIHGLEDADGVIALAMELVEGPTLQELIAAVARPDGEVSSGAASRGLPLDDTVAIARQLVDALESAHDRGIVHRDLKPANIKVRPDGTVKVLDFGLAKAVDVPTADGGATHSPTLSVHATAHGLILGTAAYMAPEQARGRPVDRRADVWAFGCVLFEMLSGRRLFQGEDISITLASVLKDDVPWHVLPDGTPPSVRRLLARCLERDPRKRLSGIGDARFDLDDADKVPAGIVASHTTEPVRAAATVPWAVAVMSLVAAGAAIVTRPSAPALPSEKVTLEFQTQTIGSSSPYMFALSADGRFVVARGVEGASSSRLILRSIADASTRFLAGVDLASHPFWSRDGKRIGYFAAGALMTVGVDGSPPERVADAPDGAGGAWNAESLIVYAPTRNGALMRISPAGGAPTPATVLDGRVNQQAHRWPRFLPDGQRFIYTAMAPDPMGAGIFVGSLDDSTLSKRLVGGAVKGEFSPPNTLLFVRGQTLFAQALDLSRMEVVGDATPIAEGVGSGSQLGAPVGLSASDSGAIAYRRGGAGTVRQLTWFDHTGKVAGAVGRPALYENPRLAPDSRRVAMHLPENGGDIWIKDLERQTDSRLTFDEAQDNQPLWSPDASTVAFVSNRDGGVFNIYSTAADGSGSNQPLWRSPNDKQLNDWSSDGRWLIYQELDPKTGWDIWALPMRSQHTGSLNLAPAAGEPVRVVVEPGNQTVAAIAPNGRWIAYSSNSSGRVEVYVQPFPPTGARYQLSTPTVSANASTNPRWSADGRELYYDASGQFMVTPVESLDGPVPRFGVPRPLFVGLMALPPHNYDVARDGRILALTSTDIDQGLAPITVIVNWRGR